MDNPYLNKRANATIFTTPPNVSVRTMAEWEEIEVLTITWSTSYGITEEVILGQIVEHAVSECDVIIICDDQNSVANYLTGIGISTQMSRLSKLISIIYGYVTMDKIPFTKTMSKNES